MSHFLEHMMFKGTPRRTALDVNLDFDRIGANYNAYTSEENTVYYAAVLPEYLPQAVDILADILRPSLRGEDFDTEKKVILEEIEHVRGPAGLGRVATTRSGIYYGQHPLGNSVLGTNGEHQRPDPRPDARATSPAATRAEHHRRVGRRATSTGTQFVRARRPRRAASWNTGRGRAATTGPSGPATAGCTC